jgi:hypothetical protein
MKLKRYFDLLKFNNKFFRISITANQLVQILSISMVIMYLILLGTRPIKYFFVDDWAIFQDFSSDQIGLNSENLKPYNGHSLLVTRFIYIIITNKLHLSISTFSILLFLSYLASLIFLAWNISRKFINSNLTFAGIILIGINLNQYQNFTMPICWSWIITLTLVYASYLLALRPLDFKSILGLSAITLIAPLILSLGFIIPIVLFCQFLLKMKQTSFNFRRAMICLTSLISFCLSYLLTINRSEKNYGKISGFEEALKKPFDAFIFLISSIGSPFTPGSRYAFGISIVFGAMIMISLALLLRKLSPTKLVSEGDFIFYGIVFHILHLLGRFDGTRDSLLIVNQPRYTTGALILLLGVFLKVMELRINQGRIYFVISIFLLMSAAGLKTAWDFSEVRSQGSNLIENCLKENGFKSNKCRDLLDPGRKILSLSDFKSALFYLERSKER